ncbi:unnamed protein product, partial [Didymodactylos carnosus]
MDDFGAIYSTGIVVFRQIEANAIGPNRVLDKPADEQLTLSDVCILDFPPCNHGAKCRDYRKPGHKAQFSHPPVCPLLNATSSCEQLDDDVHAFTFIHNTKCKFGGKCNDTDPIHLLDFDHPEFCEYGGDCTNISQKHLVAYQHLPNCPDGSKCSKYRRRYPNHLKSFRHCKSVCLYDNCCVNFHDKEHFANTIHSFRPPCPLTPYNGSKTCYESSFYEFIKKPESVVRAVQQHSRVRLIFLHHNTPIVKDNVCKLIQILVEAEFTKAKSDGKTPLDSEHDYNRLQRIEQKIQPPLNNKEIQVIHEWAVKIAQASIKLNATPMGIGYDVDEKLGTDQHVFSILGPHLAQQSAKGAFKDPLMTSIYESDEIKSGITLKDILGYTYPKYVFEQLCEAIKDRMNTQNISRGIVITVAASEFQEHIFLPITISQAYDLYYFDKPQSKDGYEFSYIYWQAMNGEFDRLKQK